MNLLNPFALLLLALLPLLVLLYFLKLKRPIIKVPSTLLWRKVIEDMRVNSPFQKLRRSILLFAQILILLAVIFALARPLLKMRDSISDSLIVLVDNSASMSAMQPDGRTRLDAACREISDWVDHLERDAEMMVIVFNNRARMACSFTKNRRELKQAISAISPTDCSTDIEPALRLVKSIALARARPRLALFSDGAFKAPSGIDLPFEIDYRRMGEEASNLALTGLDVRRSINDRNRIEMFVAVENFATSVCSGSMSVFLDDCALDTKFFSAGPRESVSQIFEAMLPSGGEIRVQLDVRDALHCDNSAWKIILPPILRRVLVVGETAYFIERVLKAAPGVECRLVTAEEAMAAPAGEVMAVIWNCVPKPGIAVANNIYFGCAPDVPGLMVKDPVESPDVSDWDNAHPLTRFIDFDNLVIGKAGLLKLPEAADVLLRSSRTPLIAMIENNGRALCVVGFDPMQSNWPLLVSFPLFLNNCLDLFEALAADRRETNLTAGKPVILQPQADAPVLETPSGARREMVRNANGSWSFTETDVCGVYRVSSKEGAPLRVAVNLFDRDESQLTTASELRIGSRKVAAAQAGTHVNREYWRTLLVAGLVLLAMEWVIYHRRLGI